MSLEENIYQSQIDKKIRNNFSIKDIYPLTVIKSRYGGVYSGGQYLAFNEYFDKVPEDVHGDDVSCATFFDKTETIIGKGSTPNEAIYDLHLKLKKEDEDTK